MTFWARARRWVLGPPKDIKDPNAFHRLSLVALLAWVGLGADGLSSSAYGPDEAFRTLGAHTELAVFLALASAATVFIISYGYSRIIEQFPAGGGGYVVASKVLGPKAGVVSGSALLVDYVLTITVSMAAGADAIFSFLPAHWAQWKLLMTLIALAVLTVLNLRGVKESVTAIAPIFAVFVVSHAVLLLVGLGGHVTDTPRVVREVGQGLDRSVGLLGLFGVIKLFFHAYSLGGGTFTGIEAVSNGVSMMREPRVETARRTMVLMATSLALTAAGLLFAYLLWDAHPEAGKTMNAVLVERITASWNWRGIAFGEAFVIVILLSEGVLLMVAAQAGFLDGPRVMASMATDSWLPHRFAALSERLTMRNGVLLMGGAATLALVYTGGSVSKLVVMYAINVFLTFTMSNVAMITYWFRHRDVDPRWRRHIPAHLIAALLCGLILIVTIIEKLTEGAWLTLLITGALVMFCFAVKRHYLQVGTMLQALDRVTPEPSPEALSRPPIASDARPDPDKPVVILFVGGYGGLGRHALLTLLRMFPGHFKGVVFASIAVVDSDVFKGAREVDALEKRTKATLQRYEEFARSLGLAAASAHAVGAEIAVEGERLGRMLSERYAQGLVVAGQIIFDEDTLFSRILHNETAFLIQRRLQRENVPMVVLPVRLGATQPQEAPAAAALLKKA